MKVTWASTLQTTKFPEPRFAVDELFPEGAAIFAGAPKIGKSWAMLQLATAVAEGRPFLGKATTAGTSLYLALEDHERRIQERLAIQLGPRPWPSGLAVCTEFPRLDQGGVKYLAQWFQEHPETRLVIIDTLERVRPRREASSVYASDYAAVAAVHTMAKEARCAVLIVHHDNKTERSDIFDSISGSKGLTGASDTMFVLKKHSRCQHYAKITVSGRDVKEGEHSVHFTPDCTWEACEEPLSPEQMEILETLTRLGPLNPGALAEALKKNPNTTRVLLLKMKNAGHVVSEEGKYRPTRADEMP